MLRFSARPIRCRTCLRGPYVTGELHDGHRDQSSTTVLLLWTRSMASAQLKSQETPPLQDIYAMTDQEQLAGYDEDGTDRTAALRALETAPSVPAASSPELRTLVAVAVAAIVVAALFIAQDVLLPITLAIMLSFVLSPLVDFLQRIGLWRAPAVALAVLVTLGAIGVLGTVLGRQAALLAGDVPQYVEAVQSKLNGAQAVATTQLAFVTRLLSGVNPTR